MVDFRSKLVGAPARCDQEHGAGDRHRWSQIRMEREQIAWCDFLPPRCVPAYACSVWSGRYRDSLQNRASSGMTIRAGMPCALCRTSLLRLRLHRREAERRQGGN